MDKVRVAQIGSGWVAENRHLPSLRKCKKTEISVIVGKDKDRVAFLSEKFSAKSFLVGNCLENKDQWLGDCDAVLVAADPNSHYEIISEALKAGKYVLTEKPLTTSVNEMHGILDLAKKTENSLYIFHNFQFSRSVKKLDRDLAVGRLGNIKSVYGFQLSNPKRRLPVWREDLPFGLFFDESPHLLYLLDKYCTDLELLDSRMIQSNENGKKTPSIVTASFAGSNGIPADLYMNFESPVSEWYLVVLGENRIGIVDVFRDIYLAIPNDGTHSAIDITRTSWNGIWQHLAGFCLSGISFLKKDYLCGSDEVVDRFADVILGNDERGRLISVEQASKINRLQFDMIDRS